MSTGKVPELWMSGFLMLKRGLAMAGKRDLRLVVGMCTIVGAAFLSGCVERKLTINTAPQGALIVLNDEEIGISPVTVGFNWYGDYKVRASREGYEILNTHRKLDAPAHDGFPLDFVADVWPGRIRDEYEWTFELTPYTRPDRAELIRDAEEMRRQANEDIEGGNE